jgi:hypothetical protein
MENTIQNTMTKTITVYLTPGRPVNPDSDRQKRLAAMDEKRINGELKRGRPVDPNSPRQVRLAEQARRAAENGGEARRGRPVNQSSDRQQRLAARELLIAGGAEVKRGRPAMPKIEG